MMGVEMLLTALVAGPCCYWTPPPLRIHGNQPSRPLGIGEWGVFLWVPWDPPPSQGTLGTTGPLPSS